MVGHGPGDNLGSGLSKLPKVDKPGLLASFVEQQRRNLQVYATEGRRYLQTWDKDQPVNSSEVGTKMEPTRTHKSETKGQGEGERAGFMTPVLKPRKPGRVDAGEIEARETVDVDVTKRSSRGVGKSGNGERRDVDKEERRADARPSKNNKGGRERPKPAKKDSGGRHSQPPSECDTETRERESRLKARKERRRERREIANPKKRKGSSEHSEGSDEEIDNRKRKKKKGVQGKKPKVPAGLALMHGFSATNVGKTRLTIEPSTRLGGVFARGKASSKTTTKKQAGSTRFSESHFLNQVFSKTKDTNADSGAVKHQQSGKESRRQSGRKEEVSKAADRGPKKRKNDRNTSSKLSGTSGSSSSDSQLEEEDAPSPQEVKVASSVTWDIERDSAALPSSDISVPSARAAQDRNGRQIATASSEVVSVRKQSSPEPEAEKSSLGPFDSASQCIRVNSAKSSTYDKRPQTDTFSKYFQKILDDDGGAEAETVRIVRPALSTVFSSDSIAISYALVPPRTNPCFDTDHEHTKPVSKAKRNDSKRGANHDIRQTESKQPPWTYPSFSEPEGDEYDFAPLPRRPRMTKELRMHDFQYRGAQALHEVWDDDEQQEALTTQQEGVHWQENSMITFAPEEQFQDAQADQSMPLAFADEHEFTNDDVGYRTGVSAVPLEHLQQWVTNDFEQENVGPGPELIWTEGDIPAEVFEEAGYEAMGDRLDRGTRWEQTFQATEYFAETEADYYQEAFEDLYSQEDDVQVYRDHQFRAAEEPQDAPECPASIEPAFQNVGTAEEDEYNDSELNAGFENYGVLEANWMEEGVAQDPCHFLGGRSALLGFEEPLAIVRREVFLEAAGATKVEIDVAKGLKNHWRPQRL